MNRYVVKFFNTSYNTYSQEVDYALVGNFTEAQRRAR